MAMAHKYGNVNPIAKSGKGYKVKLLNHPGQFASKHPMSKAKAQAQLRAIEANMHKK